MSWCRESSSSINVCCRLDVRRDLHVEDLDLLQVAAPMSNSSALFDLEGGDGCFMQTKRGNIASEQISYTTRSAIVKDQRFRDIRHPS
jgi:hypothetical protein